MDDKFLCGMLLGVIGGAVLATNSAKARQMVKDGQEQVKQKVEEMGKNSKKNEQNQLNKMAKKIFAILFQ